MIDGAGGLVDRWRHASRCRSKGIEAFDSLLLLPWLRFGFSALWFVPAFEWQRGIAGMSPVRGSAGRHGMTAAGEDEAVILDGLADIGLLAEVNVGEPDPGAVELDGFDEDRVRGVEPGEHLFGGYLFTFHFVGSSECGEHEHGQCVEQHG